MGQHNLKKKQKHKNRWILCTKWFKQIPKPIVLTEEELHADTPPKRKQEFDYIPYWTPIGTHGHQTKRGNTCGLPFEYGSEKEAIRDLKRILNVQPQNEKLLYVALEVRYAPSKIKVYKQYWFDKYVKKEVQLKVENINKQRDEFEESEEV